MIRNLDAAPLDGAAFVVGAKLGSMVALLIAILLAALAYWVCLVIGLPAVVAVIAAILVLLGGFYGRY